MKLLVVAIAGLSLSSVVATGRLCYCGRTNAGHHLMCLRGFPSPCSTFQSHQPKVTFEQAPQELTHVRVGLRVLEHFDRTVRQDLRERQSIEFTLAALETDNRRWVLPQDDHLGTLMAIERLQELPYCQRRADSLLPSFVFFSCW